MKKFNFPSLFFVLFLISLTFTSCDDSDEYNYYLVPVKNISIPDEIKSNEPFEVRLSGTIGLDGCSSFDRFITEREDTTLLVEAWGKIKTHSYTCPDMEVDLVREKLKFAIDEPGTYLLKVRQPDGTFLDKRFVVR